GFAQRPAEGALDTHLVVRPVPRLQVTFPFPGRLAGHVVNDAPGRVAAEQRSLGTLEDLHAFHVEQAEQLALLGGDVALVYVDRVRRLGEIVEVVLCYPADGERLLLPRGLPGDVDARRKARDVRAAFDIQPVQRLAGEGNDGDADI